MASQALGRAMVAAGGTFLLLGGATVAISGAAMTVTKLVVDRNKKKVLVSCPVCHGNTRTSCNVCQSERVLKYHPAKKMPTNSKAGASWSVCAMCEGSGNQTCPNCIGEGQVYPDSSFGTMARWESFPDCSATAVPGGVPGAGASWS